MKRLIAGGCVLLAAGLGLGVFLVQRQARSADHLDSPATKADATIDINDVYSWMDGNNFVVALTAYPLASSSTLFSTTAQYVAHINSGATYGAVPASTPYDIICTFTGSAAPQTAQCWAGSNEYVTGNAGQTTGIKSADGKFQVFAGPRADPFYFNLDGFKNAVATVEAVAAGGLTSNDAGCPTLTTMQSNLLIGELQHENDGGAPSDFFAAADTLAIVVSIDKSLVTTNGPVVAVWAGTYK